MTQELRPLTPEQEAEVRASIHQGREPELLYMLDASRAAHREAIARAERAEAERDEAQAALAGLREAPDRLVAYTLAVDMTRGKGWMWTGDEAVTLVRLATEARAALSASPASLAGLVRGRVLREAADLVSHHPGCIATECSAQTCNVDCEQLALRRMADEAEKGTDR